MEKIKGLELYVGTKEEFEQAYNQGMKLVIAVNTAGDYPTHKTIVGWEGRGCNKDNPYYLFKEEQEYIALNLVDTDDEKYINDKLINRVLLFIDKNLKQGEKVFIYCSKGESRSPSIALMYLLEKNLIEKNSEVFEMFKKEMYNYYNPKKGFVDYISNRWL